MSPNCVLHSNTLTPDHDTLMKIQLLKRVLSLEWHAYLTENTFQVPVGQVFLALCVFFARWQTPPPSSNASSRSLV